MKRGRGTYRPSEHDEQCVVTDWWDLCCHTWGLPQFALFAIPNAGAGGQKGRAGWLKAEGVRPGVPDLMLAVAYTLDGAFFPGLYIEMKRKPNVPSLDQKAVIAFLRLHGYHVVVAWDADEAMLAITGYLNGYRKARALESGVHLPDVGFAASSGGGGRTDVPTA